MTRRLNNTGRIRLFRAAAASELGPGCYCIKEPAEPDDQVAGSMLLREALVMRQVTHAHLATVLSCLAGQSRPRSVLPYYEGITAERLIKSRCCLPIRRVLGIGRQIASALKTLHEAGWLHGQVLARHIMVSPQAHATLIDLTGARRLGSQECDSSAASPVVGPPTPESFARRTRLSAAADTYALGLLVFELLSGRPPFQAATEREIALCHLRSRPLDIRELRSDVSLEVSELVSRLLAKDPLRRPADEELVHWFANLEIETLRL